VCGPAIAPAEILALAEQVGAALAQRCAVLICGGLGGVMEAAAHGARAAGGLTVGILPGASAEDANPFIDIPVVTDLGEARNALVVRSADAIIAIAGAYGTLSEIALALKMNVPVIGLGTWQLRAPDGSVPPIVAVQSADQAVQKAFEVIRG
jgi:hypothetical protein